MVYTIKTSISANVGLKNGKFPEKAIATKPSSFFKIAQKGFTNFNDLVDDILGRANGNRQPDIEEAKGNSNTAKKILLPPNLSEKIFKNLKVGVKVAGGIEITKDSNSEPVVDEPKAEEEIVNNVDSEGVATNLEVNEEAVEKVDDKADISFDIPEDVPQANEFEPVVEDNADIEVETNDANVENSDVNEENNEVTDLPDFFANLNSNDFDLAGVKENIPTDIIPDEESVNYQDSGSLDDKVVENVSDTSQDIEKNDSPIYGSENLPPLNVDGYTTSPVEVGEEKTVEPISADFDPYVQSVKNLENELNLKKQARDEAEQAYRDVYEAYNTKLEEVTAMAVQLKDLKKNFDQAARAYESINGAKQEALGILSGSNQLYEASVEASISNDEPAIENNDSVVKGM